ncbi:uncharacterized protein LOC116851122 [Odontomachus brunneus]|uniref:uncharacterized protein LOC116851122 n=1 Tax=Odontomachus brunneus TaxID=486640 RepID=UPI0013F28A26|nr:uncharacterized protein LOC116851122 [Odontomachus brunneus]XP_032686097.1 uncharacterized protein LOC116851122 [Odontomachus brunneus]XP_032686098.1 uncharacterized protein LOC116851122 [Odontomachus brunneus]
MTTIVRTSITSLLLLLVFYDHATGLIIPEELPTILSLIYSNIPPIKKGTDSRLGVGFRLGEHADLQILIELGPQTETDPIGTANSKRRRDAMLTAAMKGELGPLTQAVVKYQMERKIQSAMKKLQEEQLKKVQTANKTSDQDAASDNWLTRWRQEMLPSSKDNVPSSPIQDENDQEVQRRIDKPLAKSISQKDKLGELTKLYKSQNANTTGNTA